MSSSSSATALYGQTPSTIWGPKIILTTTTTTTNTPTRNNGSTLISSTNNNNNNTLQSQQQSQQQSSGTTTSVSSNKQSNSNDLLSTTTTSSSSNGGGGGGGGGDLIEISIHTLPKQLIREFRHVFPEDHLPQNDDVTTTTTTTTSEQYLHYDYNNSNNSNNRHYPSTSATNSTTINSTSTTSSSPPATARAATATATATATTAAAAAAAVEILALPTNQLSRYDLLGMNDIVEQEKDRLLNVFITFAHTLCTIVRNAGYWADYIDPCSGLPMLTPNCNKVYSEVDGMECCLYYKSYNAGFCKVLLHPKWNTSVYPATIFVRAPRQYMIQLLQSYPPSPSLSQQ